MHKAPDDEAEYLTASHAGRSFWRATLIRGGVSDGGSSAKEQKLSGNSLFNLLHLVFEAVRRFQDLTHRSTHSRDRINLT